MISTKSGFTVIEILAVITIIFILSVISFNVFLNLNTDQAWSGDVEQIIETLRLARNQTLSSKNASQYGVHFSSSKITIFTGALYNSDAPTNQDFPFSSGGTIVSLNLISGGSDIVFNRLTGEVDDYGTLVVSSSKLSKTKTITVYKTGLIESI